MNKKTIFIWTCDYSETTGEGKLARLFIKKINFTKTYNCKINQKATSSSRYMSSIVGIFYCWLKYLGNKKVCYLNYLPLWNFFIFIFLPPKTIIGPITGGANFTKTNKINYFIRGIIFPLFYKISEFFINLRFRKDIIFSTDLLKKYLSQKTIKKSKFNFILNIFQRKKKIKKKIDLLIYYRKHKNKEMFFPYNLIKTLVKNKFNIIIIGDKLNISKVKNLGIVSAKKVSKLQSIAKYTIASGENLYSFFIIECLANNVQVIINNHYKNKTKFYKNKFVKINYEKLNNLKKLKRV